VRLEVASGRLSCSSGGGPSVEVGAGKEGL